MYMLKVGNDHRPDKQIYRLTLARSLPDESVHTTQILCQLPVRRERQIPNGNPWTLPDTKLRRKWKRKSRSSRADDDVAQKWYEITIQFYHWNNTTGLFKSWTFELWSFSRGLEWWKDWANSVMSTLHPCSIWRSLWWTILSLRRESVASSIARGHLR